MIASHQLEASKMVMNCNGLNLRPAASYDPRRNATFHIQRWEAGKHQEPTESKHQRGQPQKKLNQTNKTKGHKKTTSKVHKINQKESHREPLHKF